MSKTQLTGSHLSLLAEYLLEAHFPRRKREYNSWTRETLQVSCLCHVKTSRRTRFLLTPSPDPSSLQLLLIKGLDEPELEKGVCHVGGVYRENHLC